MNVKMITKKVTALLLSLFMVASLCLPSVTSTTTAMAAETSSTIQSYTAFGDSVATGYGPLEQDSTFSTYYFNTGEGAYPRLIKDALGISEENYHAMTAVQLMIADVYYLLGGTFTDDQLTRFNEKNLSYHDSAYKAKMDDLRNNGTCRQYVANSDLITIAVGNMDIMIEPINKCNNDQTVLKEKVAQGLTEYTTYLPKILAMIYQLNPTAKVMIFSQYDSHAKLIATDAEGQAVKAQVAAINAQADGYTQQIVSTFNQQVNRAAVTYVDISGLSNYIDDYETQLSYSQYLTYLSPSVHENHPGALGHQYLRDTVLGILGVEKPAKKAKTDTSTSYLAFSSDVHTQDDEKSLKRLDTWLTTVSANLGNVTFDYMGFTGDLGSASYTGLTTNRPCTPVYWNKVARLMDVIDRNPYVGEGIYTTGNHDIGSPGYLSNANAARLSIDPYKNITRLGEAANKAQYQVYCFGAAQYNQQYNQDDIDKLSAYLKTCDKTKPVFVLSHFPIHSNASRTTTNASKVIDVLNQYPNVIFLWGHNHTDSDKHYSKIYSGSLDGTAIKFLYGSAGCMSDEEYSTGSKNTTGKGLVAKMDGTNTIRLTYYDKNGNVVSDYDADISTGKAVTHGGSLTDTDTAVYPLASSITAGKTYVIASTDSVDGSTFALNATDKTGYVTKNGNNTYQYTGLGADTVSLNDIGVNTKLSGANYWTAESVSGGIALKNVATGEYLNASYSTSVSGYAGVGTLSLATKQDAWTYSSGSMKHNTSSKVLQYQGTGDVDGTKQSGGTDFYTVRSSSKESVYVYEVSDALLAEAGTDVPVTSDVTYPLASSVNVGDTYVIASTDSLTNGTYALNTTDNAGYEQKSSSSYYKYSGLEADEVALNSKGITTQLNKANYWTVESVSGGIALKNVATGEYLNASYSKTESGYAGVGTLTLEGTQDAWTYSSGSLKHNTSSKVLQYQSDGDIDGTKQSGGADFYTVRSSSKESVYFYSVSDEQLNGSGVVVPTVVYPVSSAVTAGNTYVIASTDSVDKNSFALNTTASEGYVTVNNGNTYKYSGLGADKVSLTSKGVTTKLSGVNYWTAEAVSGGIAFKNVATGEYLNASYSKSVSGYSGVGTLTLGATQDAWTYSDSTLTHGSSSKLLQYQGSDDVDGTKQSGGTDFYTVRTSSKESVYFYSVSDEQLKEAGVTVPVAIYPLASAVTAGKTYVIASTDSVDKNSLAMNATSAEGYITVNNNNKYQYTGLGADAVELNSKGITTKLSGTNYWTAEAVSGGIAFKNVATGEYLNASYSTSVSGYSGVGTLTLEDTQDAWTYSSGSLKHNTSSKLLQYQGSGDVDGTKQSGGTDFYTVRTSSKESVYFYTVSDELLAEAGTVVPEPEDKEITKATVNTSNGNVVYDFNGEYVIANASNYAINAKTGTGYNDTSSNYRYDGLKSVKVTVSGSKITSKVSDDTIWKITPNEDATGYYIQSADGQYLNDYYTRNAGGAVNTGVRVYLSSTKASWIITADGHLQGTSSGKDLSYETNSGETEVFTLRSSGNVFNFYKVNRSGETVCTHQLTKTEAVAATCAATGTEAYWTCSKCNKMFSDSAATKEITAPVVVAKDASNHVGGTEIKNAKDATCTEAGYTGDTYCKSCNAKLTSGSAIAASGHTLVKHAAVAATETKDGNKAYYTCSVCGKYFEEDGKTETTAANVVIPATGHTHSLVKTEAVTATCTAAGTEAYWTCSKCNKMYSDAAATKEITAPVTVAATGHKYNNGLVTKAATCTAEGVKTYTCSVCGATKTEAIAKTAHVYIKHLATAATETEDGCLVHYTCDNCDTYFDADKKETLASAVIIPASGHVHVLVQMDEVPATCAATGTEVYWKCSKCHKLYSDNEGKNLLSAPVIIAKNPSNHTGIVEVKNEKAATCTEAGYTGDTYCKGCGVKLASGSAIAATGHKFGNGTVTKVPTCTEDGEVVYTCTVCAATKTEVTAKTGHKLIRHVAVAATETTAGNIEYYTCNVCQKYFLDPQATTETTAAAVVTPALSHVHDIEKVDGKAATCTEAGYKTCYRCKSCDKRFSDKAATKEITDAEPIPATGHKFDEGTVTLAPTCATQGIKTYKCTNSNCGVTKTEKLDALAHDYSKLVTVPATTLKDGSVNVLCATCGDVLLSEAIYKIDSMKLSYTSCTYSGKYRKPSVTVKDSSGDRIASSNYKVTYTNNKLVGTATVKVTFNGYKYKGTLTKTFKINPKKTSISSLSAVTKGFTVKWSKVSAQATGYQIQYATSKTFSNAKTVKVTSYKTTSKTISKLTSKKKYYVRIRTYKTSNKKYYYSAWSAVKYVTTK